MLNNEQGARDDPEVEALRELMRDIIEDCGVNYENRSEAARRLAADGPLPAVGDTGAQGPLGALPPRGFGPPPAGAGGLPGDDVKSFTETNNY